MRPPTPATPQEHVLFLSCTNAGSTRALLPTPSASHGPKFARFSDPSLGLRAPLKFLLGCP